MTTENSRVFGAVRLCVILVLFGSFFVSYAGTPVWDYDFWWHLATGRFIVTEKHIPDKDPFSLTSNLAENKNPFPELENFNLKQYWLAQSLFYIIHLYSGFKGIILLRSFLLFLTLLVVYRHMSRSGVYFFLSLIFIFLLYEASLKYLAERPVLFTIFFTAAAFSILDGFKKSRDKKIFLMIPMMLLWANLHGGFIIGDIFLLIFMFGEAVRIFLKRSDYSTYEKKLFFGVAAAAIAVSLINPTGWDAFSIAFSQKYAVLKENIQEWESPFYLVSKKIYPASSYYAYFTLLALFPLLLLIRNKRMDINHILLVSLLGYESVVSARMMIYFMIPAVVVVARELTAAIKETTERRWAGPSVRQAGYVMTLAAVCFVSFSMASHLQGGIMIADGISRSTVPKGAVDFIEKNRIEGNLFNEYGYGGYLAWRLYPWKKNFIDSRSLNIIAMKESEFILNAGHLEAKQPGRAPFSFEELLKHYRINLMLFSPTTLYGEITPAVLELLDNDNWVPVYCDPISMVYVRNTEQNKEIIDTSRIKNDMIYNSIIFLSTSTALRNKANPRYLLTVGSMFYKMGRLKEALEAYQYAAKRDPDNPSAKEMIGKIQDEIKQGKAKQGE